jgi:hypothetical protein
LRASAGGGINVQLSEAKEFVGKVCSIRWQDRSGNEQLVISKIYDATYVPLYGGYLITDNEDIRLDRISEVSSMDEATLQAIQGEKIAA